MLKIKPASKQALLDELGKLPANEEEVYMTYRPTYELVDIISKKCPAIKRIVCPPSLHKQVSKDLVRGDTTIKIEAGTTPVGRPMKYTQAIIQQMLDQCNSGKPVKQVAADLQIPMRTVYFFLSKNKS